MTKDKQLGGIRLADVLEKRRLDQALNAKEFAVLAGVSYSMARAWFRLPGFPAFHGMVFWQDFVKWRTAQSSLSNKKELDVKNSDTMPMKELPPQAAKILAMT